MPVTPAADAAGQLSFPRQHARTQRFTLGVPRSFTVAPDESRVVFLRSRSGSSRANLLWVVDPSTGAERVAADPELLLGGAGEELSAEEQARRERTRESSAGIVGYATDQAVELAAFSLSSRLFAAELRAGTVRELAVPGPVVDPRPAPDGRHIAYVVGGALRVVGVNADAGSAADHAVAEPDSPAVTWGLAEFIAAEEMHRTRGFWWSPKSDALLAARVDNSPIERWWICDPANPGNAPSQVPYPAAGTANADVRLTLFTRHQQGWGAGARSRVDVEWDRERYPYLAAVHWSAGGPPLLLVQARDQRSQLIVSVDEQTGETRPVHAEAVAVPRTSPGRPPAAGTAGGAPTGGVGPAWFDLFPGVPSWTPDGRLVRISDEGGARVLVVGDRPLTGPRLHVRAVLDVSDENVLITASAGPDAGTAPAAAEIGEVHVYQVSAAGIQRVSQAPGVHSAARSGSVTVLSSTSLDRPGPQIQVLHHGKRVAEISSHAETPVLTARVDLVSAGQHRIPCAVLLPTGYTAAGGRLPVLMDPYGGPHGQRVLAAQNAHLVSQFLADQGFAVVVADGRGTPGRSPAWEQAIVGDFAGVTLADQVEALHSLAGIYPLDLDRVAIRGWSYGGYLAALAVLRRPDVFHAAVSGAPVTDWRLYDTHYTERYLGHPTADTPGIGGPAAYATNSLITDEGLSSAAEPVRPLMLIHGLADDNVVAAHSLRLSSALLAAGRPHEVLPLSGVTHMTPQEQVAENLLLCQVAFLKRALGLT